MTVIHVEFLLTEYLQTSKGDVNIDVVNGSCNVASQLTALGLEYNKDFWFQSAFIKPSGERYIRFAFNDPGTAMLIKIRGLVTSNG